jgi:hypothetical protein
VGPTDKELPQQRLNQIASNICIIERVNIHSIVTIKLLWVISEGQTGLKIFAVIYIFIKFMHPNFLLFFFNDLTVSFRNQKVKSSSESLKFCNIHDTSLKID